MKGQAENICISIDYAKRKPFNHHQPFFSLFMPLLLSAI